jgi:hypothetical protein
MRFFVSIFFFKELLLVQIDMCRNNFNFFLNIHGVIELSVFIIDSVVMTTPGS